MKKLRPFIILFIILAIYTLFDLNCPINKYLGFRCPTCGIMSAYRALLNGDIASAFAYNPLFLLAPLVAVIFCLDIKSKVKDIIAIICAIAFGFLGIIRIISDLL